MGDAGKQTVKGKEKTMGKWEIRHPERWTQDEIALVERACRRYMPVRPDSIWFDKNKKSSFSSCWASEEAISAYDYANYASSAEEIATAAFPQRVWAYEHLIPVQERDKESVWQLLSTLGKVDAKLIAGDWRVKHPDHVWEMRAKTRKPLTWNGPIAPNYSPTLNQYVGE